MRRTAKEVAERARRLAPAARTRTTEARGQTAEHLAAEYLQEVGVAPLLLSGLSSELPPNALDLAFLHRLASRKKPTHVLEFGVGHSTLVLAHALRSTHRGEDHPRVSVVDTSQEWIDNTRAKVPPELAPYIEFRRSRACIAQLNGELCHYFEDLPDINPKLIYLDGPDPTAVEGTVRGLSFTTHDRRIPISADILLYESTLKRGTTVVIDGRNHNANFLRRSLKRRWRFETDDAEKRHQFTLLD